MSKQQQGAFLAIHSAVLLFALSGLFAKWLSLPALAIVLGRTFFAGVFLLIILLVAKRTALIIDSSHFKTLLITGFLLAIHWLTFFLAIQLSTVAFGLLAFSTFPIFTAMIESRITNTPMSKQTYFLSILVVVGIGLIFPTDSLFAESMLALVCGIVSAVSFALLLVNNRGLVKQYAFYSIACYQNLIAFLCLLPFSFFIAIEITATDWSLLVLLGVLFTAFAHSLLNYALQSIKAFQASIAISLEPVYGIFAAWWLLSEHITVNMALGAVIILAVNFYLVTNKNV